MALTSGTAAKSIELPEIKQAMIIVTVQGITSLLTNRVSERTLDEIEAKRTGKPTIKNRNLVPEEEFEAHTYRLPNGKPAIRGAAFKQSMVAAGGRLGGKKMTELRGVFRIPEELLEIRAKIRYERDYGILPTGGLDVIYRPEYLTPWEVDVPIIYFESVITEDAVIDLLRLAGESIGVGAHRMENDGTNGRFFPMRITRVDLGPIKDPEVANKQ